MPAQVLQAISIPVTGALGKLLSLEKNGDSGMPSWALSELPDAELDSLLRSCIEESVRRFTARQEPLDGLAQTVRACFPTTELEPQAFHVGSLAGSSLGTPPSSTTSASAAAPPSPLLLAVTPTPAHPLTALPPVLVGACTPVLVPGTTKYTFPRWLKAVLRIRRMRDPWNARHVHQLKPERADRHYYCAKRKLWKSDETLVKMEAAPFAAGAMRQCYAMKKFSSQGGLTEMSWKNASNYVAKRYTQPVDDQVYYEDVKLQMQSKVYGELYNRTEPPKKVDFLQAYLVEMVNRPGRPLFCVEHHMEGAYHKYNTNSGFVSDEVSRSTPQAFSHFTFIISNGKELVVDVQGVGDLYTDPQIHTITGEGYGGGNLGAEGIAMFFLTHICNPLCARIQLQCFPLADCERNNLEGSHQGSKIVIGKTLASPHWQNLHQQQQQPPPQQSPSLHGDSPHTRSSPVPIKHLRISTGHHHRPDHVEGNGFRPGSSFTDEEGSSHGGYGSSVDSGNSWVRQHMFARGRIAGAVDPGVAGPMPETPNPFDTRNRNRPNPFAHDWGQVADADGAAAAPEPTLAVTGRSLEPAPSCLSGISGEDCGLDFVAYPESDEPDSKLHSLEASVSRPQGAGGDGRKPQTSFVADSETPQQMSVPANVVVPPGAPSRVNVTPGLFARIHYEAALLHGRGLIKGDGVVSVSGLSSDPDALLFHLESAARDGLPIAQLALARVYAGLAPTSPVLADAIEDMGIDADRPTSFYYLVLAAQRGVTRAMAAVANLYTLGEVVSTDYCLAAGWLILALRGHIEDLEDALQGKGSADGEGAPAQADGCNQASLPPLPEMWKTNVGVEEEAEMEGMVGGHGAQVYDMVAALAELYSTGGHGLDKSAAKASTLYTMAGDLATDAMKGKLASKFYEQAELVWDL